jgi:O-Antigen ligase
VNAQSAHPGILEKMWRNPLHPDVVGGLGLIAFRSGLALGLLLTAYFAWASPTLALAFPVLLLGAVAGWFLFRLPLLNLAVLLASFVLIADYEDGTQITEVLWGLYYGAFVCHWYVTRIFLYKDRLFEDRESRTVFLFLILMTLSVGLTVMFKGDLRFFVGEWLSLSFFSLYFPIREAITRHRHGLLAVAISLLIVALFVQVRNVLNYQEILIEATYAWQVTKGRAVTNTAIIMLPLFGALLMLLHANKLKPALLAGAIFAFFFGGFILSQTRGHWVAFAFACIVILPIMGRSQRFRLVTIGALSVAGIVGAGYLLLGDAFELVAAGLLDRVLSIGTAASDDISLINRFRETKVVMGKVLQNPILGYGPGVAFQFWDLTFLPPFTHQTSFLHNGFVALWYKFGVWGLGLVLYFWVSSIRGGIRLYRSSAPTVLRVTGLSSAALLIAFAVSASTSNPFYVNDTMFVFAAVMGIAAGASHRWRVQSAAGHIETADA